jgi:cellulose synthase/poly-beta-1,6-N-acetylglucosamine synthase-like glycosyltransferase
VAFLFVVYLLLGPGIWLGLLIAAWSGNGRMNQLRREESPLSEPAPSLSIIVPAKDEAAGIRDCVSRVLKQDYPDAELVVINDRSGDGTGDILDAMAADDPRLKIVHVTELPTGWLGKCHALFVGTQQITSEWLLFVDSDVGLTPDAARRAVARAERRQYDALSLMPRLVAPTFWERLLLPQLAVAWGAAFQISLTNDDSRPRHAVANGQFFLIRRAWYERVGGHGAVRDRIVEDVALMRILKAAGARTRLMAGQHLVQTRMHSDLRKMFHGWARIYAGTSGRSVLPMLSVIVVMLATVIGIAFAAAIAARTHDPRWTAALAVHATLVLAFVGWAYHVARQSVVNVLLLPLAWPMVIAILAYAIRVCASGKVDWRGNAVTVNRD